VQRADQGVESEPITLGTDVMQADNQFGGMFLGRGVQATAALDPRHDQQRIVGMEQFRHRQP
jgi:hypothetical protein